ncbi:hypothetical protein [Polaromonas hydrogenivorans]|uniref:Uncharacterized protein n=1 Tax=Polaromonas hydrogenivorans TaxID=335476 RepID=A0AAU7LZW5_9BURK
MRIAYEVSAGEAQPMVWSDAFRTVLVGLLLVFAIVLLAAWRI